MPMSERKLSSYEFQMNAAVISEEQFSIRLNFKLPQYLHASFLWSNVWESSVPRRYENKNSSIISEETIWKPSYLMLKFLQTEIVAVDVTKVSARNICPSLLEQCRLVLGNGTTSSELRANASSSSWPAAMMPSKASYLERQAPRSCYQ
ncbi:hypothetical protein COCNU_09G005000 [Cocos nucifera]|uniref:Uncharacterized protein n=1 Tax=Cocos nucifera TaxID=13894 RepID=A0A8K0N6Q7_COCNU|nr:hypothetical protein COCNU_09G005000 [Cocos nucifera]